MQKKDMIKDLADKYKISQAESKRIFDAVFDQLSEVLSKGDYFTEAGFGTFTVAHVKKRKGYNPAIQKFMMLPPKLKPKFKSSDILKSKVNGWLNDTIIDDDDSDDDDNEEKNNEISTSSPVLSTNSPVISTEAEKSPESSAAMDSSAVLGMTNAAGEINAAAFDKPVEQTSDHPETEIVTPEEQSALINDENQEAANG
ncbi:MAG: HU family DNA-binding protein [Spirochaetales bacterium]|nr:HU family DNA-binding protein [Spirochaetales bacterium]